MHRDRFWKLSLVITGLVLLDQFSKGIVQTIFEQNNKTSVAIIPNFLILKLSIGNVWPFENDQWNFHIAVILLLIFAYLILSAWIYFRINKKNIYMIWWWSFMFAGLLSSMIDIFMFNHHVMILEFFRYDWSLSLLYLFTSICLFTFALYGSFFKGRKCFQH